MTKGPNPRGSVLADVSRHHMLVGGGTMPGLPWATTHRNPRFPSMYGPWEAVSHREMVTSVSFCRRPT
jgi:hypothetical protein